MIQSQIAALAELGQELRGDLKEQLKNLSQQLAAQKAEADSLRAELTAREAQTRERLALSSEEQLELRSQLREEAALLRAACRHLDEDSQALQRRMERLVSEREEELASLRAAQKQLFVRLAAEERSLQGREKALVQEASAAEAELLARHSLLLARVGVLARLNDELSRDAQERADCCRGEAASQGPAAPSESLLKRMKTELEQRIRDTCQDVSAFKAQLRERSQVSQALLDRVCLQLEEIKTQLGQRQTPSPLPQEEQEDGKEAGKTGIASSAKLDASAPLGSLRLTLVGLIASNWETQQRLQKTAENHPLAGVSSQSAIASLKKEAVSLAGRLDELLSLLRSEANAVPASEGARVSLIQDRTASVQKLQEEQRRLDVRVDEYARDLQSQFGKAWAAAAPHCRGVCADTATFFSCGALQTPPRWRRRARVCAAKTKT